MKVQWCLIDVENEKILHRLGDSFEIEHGISEAIEMDEGGKVRLRGIREKIKRELMEEVNEEVHWCGNPFLGNRGRNMRNNGNFKPKFNELK